MGLFHSWLSRSCRRLPRGVACGFSKFVVVLTAVSGPSSIIMVPAEIIAPVDDRSDLTTPGTAVVASPDEVSLRRSRKRRSSERDGTTGSENAGAENDSSKSKTAYQCRFCKMNFEKSQALGGHMNRHRQEREKEQYHNAQMLVSGMHQQQMPRAWTSLAAATEIQQSPSAPGAPSRLSSPLTGAAATRAFGPPISFANYRGPVGPTTGSNMSVPSSPPSGSYYLPSNSSSNNLHNAQWNLDGSFRSGNFSIEHTATSFQGTGSELLSRVLQDTATATVTNDGNSGNVNSNQMSHIHQSLFGPTYGYGM